MCGGGSWQRAGCERSGYAGLGTVRSLQGTDGTGQGCCRCPGHRRGQDTADQVQPVSGSSLPAAAKTGSGPGCGGADSER